MSNLDIVRPENSSFQWVGRLLIWSILLLFCFWFLMPAYVVISTSLKNLEEIRGGSLLALPQ